MNAGAPITVFEITTAVAFLLFARVPADLLVLEVGLGGRFDATNVVDAPAATAITSISMDHMDFLGDTLGEDRLREGGHHQARRALRDRRAAARGARGVRARGGGARRAAAAPRPRLATMRGTRTAALPGATRRRAGPAAPGLPGPHQADNAGIAIAALRAWNPPWLTEAAIADGVARAEWPARMQRLTGRLAALLPAGWELWLDGGHNAGAGVVIAAAPRRRLSPTGRCMCWSA